jgi:protein-tyrosine-phosphatase
MCGVRYSEIIYTEDRRSPPPMPDNANRKPTIDERLDRLTERHETLTETVELIVAMQRENEARFAQIAANQERDAEHINALVRIAEIHEHRLSGLEGDRPR